MAFPVGVFTKMCSGGGGFGLGVVGGGFGLGGRRSAPPFAVARQKK